MSKPLDLNGLAKQYLDLWQQQLGGVAEDDQAAEIMARTVELMNAGASTFPTMAATAQGYPTRNAGHLLYAGPRHVDRCR